MDRAAVAGLVEKIVQLKAFIALADDDVTKAITRRQQLASEVEKTISAFAAMTGDGGRHGVLYDGQWYRVDDRNYTGYDSPPGARFVGSPIVIADVTPEAKSERARQSIERDEKAEVLAMVDKVREATMGGLKVAPQDGGDVKKAGRTVTLKSSDAPPG